MRLFFVVVTFGLVEAALALPAIGVPHVAPRERLDIVLMDTASSTQRVKLGRIVYRA